LRGADSGRPSPMLPRRLAHAICRLGRKLLAVAARPACSGMVAGALDALLHRQQDRSLLQAAQAALMAGGLHPRAVVLHRSTVGGGAVHLSLLMIARWRRLSASTASTAGDGDSGAAACDPIFDATAARQQVEALVGSLRHCE